MCFLENVADELFRQSRYYVEKSKAEKLSNSVRILKKNQADSMF
jgi:hypothetical protein